MANSAPGGSFGRAGSSQFITVVAMAATYVATKLELGCGLSVSQSHYEAEEQSRMIQKVSRIERGERGEDPESSARWTHRGPKPNPLGAGASCRRLAQLHAATLTTGSGASPFVLSFL